MTDRDLGKAIASIRRSFDVVAVATYGGDGLLVIVRTGITSRARRAAAVREAMGRHGRRFELSVYTPEEVREARGRPEDPLGAILEGCDVVAGTLDGD